MRDGDEARGIQRQGGSFPARFDLILPRSLAEEVQAMRKAEEFKPSRIWSLFDRGTTYPKMRQIGQALGMMNAVYADGYRKGTHKDEVMDIWRRYVKEGELMRLGGYVLDTSGGRQFWDRFNESRDLFGEAVQSRNVALVDQAYERIESLTQRRGEMK